MGKYVKDIDNDESKGALDVLLYSSLKTRRFFNIYH